MTTENSVTTGYEAEPREMADALRGSMDAPSTSTSCSG